jgi:hypothetical protein
MSLQAADGMQSSLTSLVVVILDLLKLSVCNGKQCPPHDCLPTGSLQVWLSR